MLRPVYKHLDVKYLKAWEGLVFAYVLMSGLCSPEGYAVTCTPLLKGQREPLWRVCTLMSGLIVII